MRCCGFCKFFCAVLRFSDPLYAPLHKQKALPVQFSGQIHLELLLCKHSLSSFWHYCSTVLGIGARLTTTLKPKQALLALHNSALNTKTRMNSTSSYTFETLAVSKPQEHVVQVELNRPDKRNAMNKAFWR